MKLANITLISLTGHAFGIRILSACLKKEGHNVQIILLPTPFACQYKDNILKEVVALSEEADLIGISLMTNFFDNAVQVTQKLKENLSVPVLWGGIHPTICPTECLDHADMVCIGDGEETVVELVRKIENEEDYRNVQGIWLKEGDNIIKNEKRPLIQDLDSIPFPDYDLENCYVLGAKGNRIHKMDEDMLKKRAMGGVYSTIPTRGCPSGCSYCCNNTLNKMYPTQKTTRKRSVDNIIEELTEIKGKLPFIDTIRFEDDNFFCYTVEEIADFCEKYKKNVDLPLIVYGASPSTLTREKLSFLVDAGLVKIRLGIQTGSKSTKRLYKRHHSNQQIEKATRIINEFKDKIKLPLYDIILDNPWETDIDSIETLMLLTRIPPPYELTLFSLTFYPETELYRKAKRNGIITNELNEVYSKHYKKHKKTYLNGLFVLMKEYASGGGRISTKMMSLLTNRHLRRFKLSWLLYFILKVGAIPFRIRYSWHLLCQGLKDVQKGRWYRIIKYTTGAS